VVVGFAVAFRFKKVLEAWIQMRGKLGGEELQLLAVGDQVGTVGQFLGGDGREIVLDGLEENVLRLRGVHALRVGRRKWCCRMLESARGVI